MKYKLLLCMAIACGTVQAQTDSIQWSQMRDSIEVLTSQVTALQSTNTVLQQSMQDVSSRLGNTETQVQQNTANIRTTAEELGVKIDTTSTLLSEQQSALQRNVRSKTGWGIGLVVVLLALAGAIYFVLRRKIQGNGDVIEQIRSSQQRLQEESVKLDSQLVELLEKQMSVIGSSIENNATPDHSLILKVADEIVIMEANLARMDSSIKGYKFLRRSINHIKDNFMSKGYEFVDMLGKPYVEGMRAKVTFVPNEEMEEGQRVITRIIKPQINYKGTMIQPAQIEVSQN